MNKNKHVNVVLTGNPNTGKTSLLNVLTGLNLHVGNWPGKTVEKKEGKIIYKNVQINIMDLPGSYSIAPYSEEEKVSHEFLISQEYDIIVQTIDVNALERNLLMTFELLALGKKVILAFNFNKEAESRGISVNVDGVRSVLQVPIVTIEANTGENKEALLDAILETALSETSEPNYMHALCKGNYEIHHDEAIHFFKKNIAPFYSTANAGLRTEKIDGILLNRYTALPFFLLIIFFIFEVMLILSVPLVSLLRSFFYWLGQEVKLLDMPGIISSFIVDGVLSGLGTVLSFIPLVFILFLLIAVLEDSGYLVRTVVLVDPLFKKFGITGRSFIPMVLGFACNVPAIMATRTIKDERERKIAIFTNAYMSCGSRLPIYVMFAEMFYPDNLVLIIIMLYLTGVLIALAASYILTKLLRPQKESTLIIELPHYRMPTVKNIVNHAWYHTREFIKKAGTIIFSSVVVIWILASLPIGVSYSSETSLLGRFGQAISPFFEPLGFGYWTFVVALIFGIVAKEAIISSLGTLYGVGDVGLSAIIPLHLTGLGALSFLFFVLLYTPCFATLAIIKHESGSWKYTILLLLITVLVAWFISFCVYNVGLLLGFH